MFNDSMIKETKKFSILVQSKKMLKRVDSYTIVFFITKKKNYASKYCIS